MPMMMDSKKVAALIVGKKLGSGSPDRAAESREAAEGFFQKQSEVAGSGTEDALQTAATAFVAAVSGGEASSVARAFKNMWTICEREEYAAPADDEE